MEESHCHGQGYQGNTEHSETEGESVKDEDVGGSEICDKIVAWEDDIAADDDCQVSPINNCANNAQVTSMNPINNEPTVTTEVITPVQGKAAVAIIRLVL